MGVGVIQVGGFAVVFIVVGYGRLVVLCVYRWYGSGGEAEEVLGLLTVWDNWLEIWHVTK